VSRAQLPTPDTCAPCHADQVAQFKRGKHARAWIAVKTIPTFHHLDEARPGDPSGCATCHRIGLKPAAEARALREAGAAHGMASCDACHTRHLFSKAEASQPEACRSCHGDLQFAAWSESKHGERHQLRARGGLPAEAAAPTCQVCHLPGGDHAVRTPWGNLGLRLPWTAKIYGFEDEWGPLLADDAWAADRATLLRALGVLDAAGNPGPRAEAVGGAGLAHLDRIEFQNERRRLTSACRQCHGVRFIREQLDRRDGLLREADRLGAQAVLEVAALQAEGLVPPSPEGRFPDLVTASTGTAVERQLARMFFDHRAKLLATAFHMSSEVPRWRTALVRDLAQIRREAAALRAAAGREKRRAPPRG